MKQKKIANKWKKCSIKLAYPFYITVTDMSVENAKPMPYKAIELVEQCHPDTITTIKEKHLKFKLISNKPEQNMKVQCRDFDEYLDLTSSISCMIDLYKFTDVQNLKSKHRMAKTASVEAEQRMASKSVTDVGHDEVTEGKVAQENGAADVSEHDRADQCSVASFETDSSFDDYDDDEGPEQPSDTASELASNENERGMARSISPSPSILSLTSTTSSTMSYFSCVEEIHNLDMATASALDSERPVLNPDSNLSASSTLSPGYDITKLQAADTSVQHVAECVSVPVVEDIPAGNDTTDKEYFGSIQVAGTGASIVEDHFVGSKQMGAGDFMQCDQQLLSPNDIDVRDQSSVSDNVRDQSSVSDNVRGQSSVSDNVKVSQSVQPELEQTAKKCRRRHRSRIRRILRWFTKCIRANDSDVEQ